jgi:tRNA threonylcarbamoyl adenosine modification protein YeaZ
MAGGSRALPSGGLLLTLNAAEGLLQFALAAWPEDGNGGEPFLLCAQSWNAPSQGAEVLAPALGEALRRLKRAPGNIRAIACVRGPGSFTGLRLALATAAGLGRATGALQAGLDYLPLLAANALSLLGECAPDCSHIWITTHARRQLVHAQGFALSPQIASTQPDDAAPAATPRAASPVTDILVCSPQELAAVMTAHAVTGQRFAVAGSGLGRNRAAFAAAFAADPSLSPLLLPPAYDNPSAATLLRAAAAADYAPKDIAPLYARPSDAEENLERIAQSLGLDPAKARERLSALLRQGV